MTVFLSPPNWLMNGIKMPLLLILLSVSIDREFWPHQRRKHTGQITFHYRSILQVLKDNQYISEYTITTTI